MPSHLFPAEGLLSGCTFVPCKIKKPDRKKSPVGSGGNVFKARRKGGGDLFSFQRSFNSF